MAKICQNSYVYTNSTRFPARMICLIRLFLQYPGEPPLKEKHHEGIFICSEQSDETAALSVTACGMGVICRFCDRLGIPGCYKQNLSVPGRSDGIHHRITDRVWHDADDRKPLSFSGKPVSWYRRSVQLRQVHLRLRPRLPGCLVHVSGDQARKAANTDRLTGVKSKHVFAAEEEEIDAEIEAGNITDFAVIVCDVNGLKKNNDTLGHKAGDAYIISACDMLCEFYKQSAVFRIGGDEFMVLLKGVDFEHRDELLHRINTQIEENLKAGRVVASLGMTEYMSETDHSFQEVFKRVDGLMYERKMELKKMGAVTRD